MSMLFNRHCKRIMWRQATNNKSTIYKIAGQFIESSPFTKRQCFPLVSHESGNLSVVNLFGWCRPSAIIRRIVTRVVNSVNCMFFRWFITNISKEVFKLKPTLANGNTNSTVRRIFMIGFRKASGSHMAPRFVFNSVPHAVSNRGFTSTFSLKAATRLSMVHLEIITVNNASIATYADTIPADNISVIGGTRNNSKTIKYLTGAVNKISRCHNILSDMAQSGCFVATKSESFAFGNYPSHNAIIA